VNFVDLTGARDDASQAQPARNLTDIGLALGSARQAAIDARKVPLVLFDHIDPLIVRFGPAQVSKFLHDTAIRVRTIGGFECYLLTRKICSEAAYASLVSLSDAALRFTPSEPNGAGGALLELIKYRGVRTREVSIPLTLNDDLRYGFSKPKNGERDAIRLE
jgi:hypothetical protein